MVDLKNLIFPIRILRYWGKISESPIGILLFWPCLIFILGFYSISRCFTSIVLSIFYFSSDRSSQIAAEYCDSNGIFGFVTPFGNFLSNNFYLALLLSIVLWIIYKYILYKTRKHH